MLRPASVLLACVLLACGCTADEPTPVAEPSPVPTPAPEVVPEVVSTPASTPPVDRQVVREGVATVQRYLDVWADEGIVAAGRFVVPAERITSPSGQGLAAGGVTHHELVSWTGPDRFTLDVWMSLTAEDVTDPFQARLAVAANQHPHRITFRRTPAGRYLLSFSTT